MNYNLIITESLIALTLLAYFWNRHINARLLAKRITAVEVQSVVCDTNVRVLAKTFHDFVDLTNTRLDSIQLGIETLLARTEDM